MSLRILFISPQNVIPPNDGGKQSIYYPIKYLAKENDIEIFLIVIAQRNEIVGKNEYLDLGVKDIEILFLDKKDTPLKVIKNIFEEKPFKWSKYINMESKIKGVSFACRVKPDVIICSSPHTLAYGLEIKRKLNIPVILREHNIEHELVRQFYKLIKNPVYKFIGYWQFYKTLINERKYWEQCDKVLFISDSDYEIAINRRPDLKFKFKVLYDGFEIKKNGQDILLSQRESNSFIISAPVKSSLQNVYNLNWFLNNIWRSFIKNNKKYKLYLTGSTLVDLERYLRINERDLKEMNVTNLGFVDDLDEILSKKKYFISPTFFGSGIRLKVLHALSLGLPVFLTEIDYKTVKKFKDMENVILFRNVEEFKIKLENVEKNQTLYKKLSLNGINLIHEKLNWQRYVKELLGIIQDIKRSYE